MAGALAKYRRRACSRGENGGASAPLLLAQPAGSKAVGVRPSNMAVLGPSSEPSGTETPAAMCERNVGDSSHYGGDPIFSPKGSPFERGSDTGPTMIARKRRSIPSQDGRFSSVPGLF